MPRRSSRAVPASTTKKRASDRLPAEQTDAKKPRHGPESVRTTARRSQYFEQGGEEESGKEPQSGADDESEVEEGSESAAEETKVTATSPSLGSKRSSAAAAAGAGAGAGGAQKEQKKSQGSKGKGKKRGTDTSSKHDDNDATDLEEGGGAAASLKDKELWREGVRTGLGPGKEVFIQKPKARDPGKVAYQDQTLHPNTMLFLQDLKENNDRQWLKGKVICGIDVML